MSGLEKYCIHCMRELGEDGVCHFCTENRTEQGSHQLKPGTKLGQGNYVIGDVLGEGGFGITYIGRDTNLLSLVAIKEYYPIELAERNRQDGLSVHVRTGVKDAKEHFASGMDKFLDEARILSRFAQIEGITKVHQFFRENNTAYFVMDYVDGVSIKDYVAQHGRLKSETVLEMVRKPILALQKVHESGLVHRDISADNLMVSVDGTLTLIDFGASRMTSTLDDRTRTTFYKPSFSALEQYSQKSLQGAWTDVYGLCATMYYMLSGELPPSATERVIEDCLKPLENISGVDISHALSKVICNGMAVDKNKRIQNMGQLYEALYGEKELSSTSVEKNFLEGIERGKSKKAEEKESLTARLFSLTHVARELDGIAQKRRQSLYRKRVKLVGIIAVCLCVAAGSVWGYMQLKSDNAEQAATSGQLKSSNAEQTAASGQHKEQSERKDTLKKTASQENTQKSTVDQAASQKEATTGKASGQEPEKKVSSTQKAVKQTNTTPKPSSTGKNTSKQKNTTKKAAKTVSSQKTSQSKKNTSTQKASKKTSAKNTTKQNATKKSATASKAKTDEKIMKLPDGGDGLDGDLDSMK